MNEPAEDSVVGLESVLCHLQLQGRCRGRQAIVKPGTRIVKVIALRQAQRLGLTSGLIDGRPGPKGL
jgi:hypothetical protein